MAVREGKKRNSAAIRRMKYGGMAAALTAAFLAAAVLLNLVLQTAAQRVPLSVDLTANQAFALSEESKSFLRKLEKPVSITVLIDELTLENAGGYYAQAREIIDQYEKYSSLVEVSYVDPVVNPGIIAQYPELSLEEYDILVICGGRQEKTSLPALFQTGYAQATGTQYIQASCAEREISSAILRCVSDRREKVLLLTGQEEVYPDALRELLCDGGYEAAERNLLTDTLDGDARAVLLMAPQRDLELDMLQKLEDYLEGGADRTLIFAAHPSSGMLPNLTAFLAQWGITLGDAIVMESDAARYANGLPYICLVDYAGADYAEDLTASFLSPLGRTIVPSFSEKGVYTTEVLLTYGESAYARPMDADADWSLDQEDFGTWPALIRSTRTSHIDGAVYQGRVLAFASAASFDAGALENASVSNRQYISNVLGVATARPDGLTIPTKALAQPQLGITQAQYYLYCALFVVALPVVILVIGLAVWLRRRSR